MNITQAIEIITKHLKDELVIAANGRISREAFAINNRPENFYMIGSMGLAPAIALGLALSRPERRVIILDGDGNLLMSLGILPQIGSLAPKNLVHIVLDNEVYGSTGNQPTISSRVPLEDIAEASKYSEVVKVTGPEALRAALERCLKAHGPSFILAKIEADHMEKRLSRVTHPPVEIKERFMSSMAGET